MTQKNTNKAFKLSIICIILTFLIVILSSFHENASFYVISTIIGVLTFMIGIFSIIGFFNAMKSFKEKNSFKKIMALLVHSGFVLLFIYILAANGKDFISFFN
ncbi:hypothetical protein [Polaribacter sp. IC073]|uniref:hypothetical protein n=1 Tax=Polaribacter sp. IC073 TaxID=2508540 RepID=UPI0011BECD0C|nr:hypothetical protein [Polaribacter sp. IC073]TXD48407.1 hypothetical protein ES045_08265 [Polaribacter sp. IC073]